MPQTKGSVQNNSAVSNTGNHTAMFWFHALKL
jgi:hypothetical protein